jgi:hypothetical protein
MPYSSRNLRVICELAPAIDGQPAPVLATYVTTDTIANVNTANYFLPAINMLPLNSLLIIISGVGTTPVHSFAMINQNAAGAIDLTDGAPIATTDTD